MSGKTRDEGEGRKCIYVHYSTIHVGCSEEDSRSLIDNTISNALRSLGRSLETLTTLVL